MTTQALVACQLNMVNRRREIRLLRGNTDEAARLRTGRVADITPYRGIGVLIEDGGKAFGLKVDVLGDGAFSALRRGDRVRFETGGCGDVVGVERLSNEKRP